jgi:hypothetical protein
MDLCLVGVGPALRRFGAQLHAELLEFQLVGRALQHCMAQLLE